MPVAHQFPDGAWLVSVEVWGHGVVVRYAQPQPPYRPPHNRREWHGWVISDDAGTDYARVGTGGGGNRQHGYHGDGAFEPAPPPEATVLLIRRETTDEAISVSLTD